MQARIKDAKTVSRALTENASDMHVVKPYRTIQRGEPLSPKPETYSSTAFLHKRIVIQALARVDMNAEHPDAVEQMIASYNGFHAGLNAEQGKSKAYFQYGQTVNHHHH